MAQGDMITMTQKEIRQLHVIRKVIDGALTQKQAAEILSLSTRQVRRKVRRIEAGGDRAIQHCSRGMDSHNKRSDTLRLKVERLCREKYQDYGPTLTAEKLLELDDISVSKETVRMWLMEDGQWKKRRKGVKHRQWRERKGCFGEMLQLDGSHHDWFAGRNEVCVLMAYIDDATSRVYARFYEYEGTIPAIDLTRRYVRKYGIPISVYMDKHTTYKSPAPLSVEDEINGTTPLSEFGRALTELSVEPIHAHSPQAKGRVERLFKTLQDRLVKEFTLKGISTVEAANRHIDAYLSGHNKRFAVTARVQENLHRAIPAGTDLDSVLCIKTVRVLRNDFTVAHNKKLYQVGKGVAAKTVTVEERIRGSVFITHNGVRLPFKEITGLALQPKAPMPAHAPRIMPVKPTANHPWRKCDTFLHKKIRNSGNKPLVAATV